MGVDWNDLAADLIVRIGICFGFLLAFAVMHENAHAGICQQEGGTAQISADMGNLRLITECSKTTQMILLLNGLNDIIGYPAYVIFMAWLALRRAG